MINFIDDTNEPEKSKQIKTSLHSHHPKQTTAPKLKSQADQ